MSQERLRAIVFAGVQNLPIFAAQTRGYFTRRGIDLELTMTGSSQEQRDGLVTGSYDIAHSAVDNALALVDVAGEDVVSFIGLERGGTNKLVVQTSIQSYDDLRGKVLGVDALDTAFALLAYEVLERQGLMKERDYQVLQVGATKQRLEALIAGRCDFALLMLPFWLQAEATGLHVLDDPHRVIGTYQGAAGFALRTWVDTHEDILSRYIAGFIEGLRWVMDPANRSGAAALLTEKMKMDEGLALRCCGIILEPSAVFADDAKLSIDGLEAVMHLRAKFTRKKNARPPAGYVDETCYRKALAMV